MKSILTLCATVFFIAANAQNTPSKIDTASVKVFTSVRVQAQFPGGATAWGKYLQHNLRAEVAGDNIVLKRRQKDSLQKVIVSFLVDTTGNITEVQVENPEMVHPKVGAEAVRVIQQGPKWLPATINGAKVIYRQIQSITFIVSKG
jgi:protein TonB